MSYTPEELAKIWRNGELSATDNFVIIPDYPKRDEYITYREELRDWPSTSDFPGKRPSMTPYETVVLDDNEDGYDYQADSNGGA
jgi:hypothetical protein